MSEKDIAEKFVRGKIEELMKLSFGCAIKSGSGTYCFINGTLDIEEPWSIWIDDEGRILDGSSLIIDKILGHKIELHHWLSMLDHGECQVCFGNGLMDVTYDDFISVFTFNLTTGQPSTLADYQKFNEIVGAKE